MKTGMVTIVVLACLLCGGCTEQLNPSTGEQETIVSPKAVVVLDTAAEAAPGLAGLMALLFPALLPVSTLLVGAAGMWKRMKPKIAAATKEADVYHAATESIVQVLEQWKATNSDAWETLRAKLGNSIGDNTEAVIRAIRGLPPKD